MKRDLIIAAATILLIATPAYAVSSHANGNGQSGDVHGNTTSQQEVEEHVNHNSNPQVNNNDDVNPSVTPSTTPSVTPSVTPSTTPAEDEVESNDVVSPTSTDCDPAAHWKNHGEYVSCVAHLHLGGKTVSDAAKSDVGKHHDDLTPSPTASVTPSVSPTPPISSGVNALNQLTSPLSHIGGIFARILDFLSHIL